ncbi:hypothetical protein CALCODRAFT_413280, partial [Calocera cornea HHB12733]
MRLSDPKILAILKEENLFDQSKYRLGLSHFKKIRRSLGLISTAEQQQTVESVTPAMRRLREKYPKAGVRDMMKNLFFEEGMKVPRRIVIGYFHQYEPDLIHSRRSARLQRKRFWSAGVNDIWCMDQHDKWSRFGLRLHTGIEPYSGMILWLKVWHNHHPKLIAQYYFEAVTRLGCMPLVTQSDLGSENYRMAKAHTAMRHYHDPSLHGTLQHRWMRHKKNIKPEISWSQMRRRFTPGFEDKLDEGVNEGWYDPDQPLHLLVFYWLFIPYLQSEIDCWVHSLNYSSKRRDKNKILPQGRPQLIFEHATRFGTLDFGVKVDHAAIAALQPVYAPQDTPHLELVPPGFAIIADALYDELGRPAVAWGNIWDVFRTLVWKFQTTRMDDPVIQGALEHEWNPHIAALAEAHELEEEGEPKGMPLKDGMPVSSGLAYMGGVAGGLG